MSGVSSCCLGFKRQAGKAQVLGRQGQVTPMTAGARPYVRPARERGDYYLLRNK